MKQNKLLIFGISGFVGPYLASEFKENGYEIFGSDRAFTSCPFDFPFYEADITCSDDVNKVIRSVLPDVIVNLAALSSVGQSWKMPQLTMDINVIGALNILEAARAIYPSPKVMFIGSSEEYKASSLPIDENAPLDANNPYGISKIAQEQFASLYREQYGMKVYCVRPFNHTGIGQRETFVLPSFCKQVAAIEKSGKAGVIKVGNLSAFRDFSHVKDIVRAYRLIIENSDCNKIYNVGSGHVHKLEEILEFILSLSSQKVEVEIDNKRFRPIDTPYICCNNNAIKEELGWIPEFTIFDAVKDLFDYFLLK